MAIYVSVVFRLCSNHLPAFLNIDLCHLHTAFLSCWFGYLVAARMSAGYRAPASCNGLGQKGCMTLLKGKPIDSYWITICVLRFMWSPVVTHTVKSYCRVIFYPPRFTTCFLFCHVSCCIWRPWWHSPHITPSSAKFVLSCWSACMNKLVSTPHNSQKNYTGYFYGAASHRNWHHSTSWVWFISNK